ncbi:MAG: hypothetical protein KJ734_15635, partial [Chloroflexi bacterium]|nr:hypothetical protein [Chloroflexota bacterium]
MRARLGSLGPALVLVLAACTQSDSAPAQTPVLVVASPTPGVPTVIPIPCIPCQKRGAGEPSLVVTRPLIDARGPWTYYVNANDYTVVLALGDVIWAGTDAGLFQWNNQGQWQRFARPDGLPGDAITALAGTPGGDLWVGTNQGVARRASDGDWLALDTPASVRALAVDPQGRVWVALADGLGLAQLDPGSQLMLAAGWPGDDAHVVTTDAQGQAWCGTNAGVVVYDGSSWQRTTLADMGLPAGEPVTAIALNATGQVWCRAGDAVAHYDGRAWIAYPSAYEAVVAGFLAVRGAVNPNGLWCADAGGNVWLQGTRRVEVYDGERWSPQPFTAHDARAMSADAQGRLWLGLSGAGLLRITPDDERVLYVLEGPPANQLVAVAAAGDHTIWCGTASAGVGVLALAGAADGPTWQVYDAQNSPVQSAVIERISTDLAGVWVAVAGGALYRFRDGQWLTYESVWQAVESEYVILVASGVTRGPNWLAAAPGRVWAWDGDTLGCYDGVAWQRYPVPGAGSVHLTRVARDAAGRLWCGTYGHGLFVFDPAGAQWSPYTRAGNELAS